MDDLIDISKTNVGRGENPSGPLWEVVIDNYRYVLFGINKVLVYKGDSEAPTYEITNYSCSCPGDRYSANPCKHRKAVSFLGDGSSGTPSVEKKPEVTERKQSTLPDLLDLDSVL